MSRVKTGKISKNRHKKILKLAKGYRGRANNCFSIAIEKVEKALRYAYRDRRNRKRDFRGLWVQRINAAVRQHGLVYSQFMGSLKKAAIDIDRKVLAELAVNNPQGFSDIVNQVKAQIEVKMPLELSADF
ncbi:50S ribosomal protein L20 [Pseudolycoriella hygida]|uniref:Large ribosomal subunit protein bL20c n=1 Tax=Pseudolycoriella hygida TaxID=35572 RepID=A0A9Q0N7U4_9DIPT|nr:50S ribosomal protein L20 [Pseudolycoriella hygida]